MAFIYNHGGEKKMDLMKDRAEMAKQQAGIFDTILGGQPDRPSDPAANRRVPLSARLFTGQPKWGYFALPLVAGAFLLVMQPWHWHFRRFGDKK
ncbi:hypothetical protein GPALN_006238 [Globodera pallida]|nr:hypothetical protein GPALN_006238 [Globodera pallida]